MFSLVLSIISISLVSAFLLITVNYMNPEAALAGQMKDGLNQGLYQLEVGYEDFVTVNGTEPSNIGQLTPDYAFTPPAIFRGAGASWGLSPGATSGRYVCLSGTLNKTHLRAAVNSKSMHSAQAFFINSTCGATTNSIPVLTGSQTQSLAVTYWLSSY